MYDLDPGVKWNFAQECAVIDEESISFEGPVNHTVVGSISIESMIKYVQ